MHQVVASGEKRSSCHRTHKMTKSIIALLFFVAALPSRADMASGAAISSSDLDEALGSDETCGATGEEAAICALNALQRQVDMHAQGAGEEAQGSCTSGMVGKVNSMAPGCLTPCPQACGPLGQAISAFMRGRQPAAKKVVCQYKHQFACLYGNYGKCKVLISKAASMGFHLPSSKGGLYGECR